MPEPFSKVLLDELRSIDLRRGQAPDTPAPAVDISVPHAAEHQALKRDVAGMGISGGGIRSATFNLGILQGLAEHHLLSQLDYLSTVSGGGYIGSWLHGVILRMHAGWPGGADDRLSPKDHPVPGAPAEDPVSFLRKYSNYLAPRLSLFSTDVWVIAAIWLRNMFLNWCVLVPFLAAVLLVPVAGGLLHMLLDSSDLSGSGLAAHERLLEISLLPSLLMLAAAVWIMAKRLDEVAQRTFHQNAEASQRRKADAGWCGALIFCAGVLMGSTATNPLNWYWWAHIIGVSGIWLMFFLLLAKGGFLTCYRSRRSKARGALGWAFLISLACTVFTAALLIVALRWMSGWEGKEAPWAVLALGPAFVIAALSTGIVMMLGLMGADYPDAAREWVSRLGAQLAIWVTAWAALFAVGVYSPLWVAMLFATFWKTSVAGVAGWVATSAGGIFSANSGKTKGPGAQASASEKAMEILARLAPAIFMTGFLILISSGLHWGIRELTGNNQPAASAAWTSSVIANHWEALQPQGSLALEVIAILAGLVLWTLLFAVRININEFSMHHFYKNRLVRCYLGASKGRRRRPNSWTGFDPQDDIPLSHLHAGRGYYGPYPIVNTSVNLNHGSELAKQERKAGSFVYTPLYCGFIPERSEQDAREVAAQRTLHEHGFRPTDEFGGKGGPHLGSAMAISGAAANPNMGFHTSGPVAFLLTMFNVRLGWWVGNPRRDRPSSRPGPLFSLLYLLNELTGRTDDRSSYLNLSDGGHFENLGLYELVRRRCRFIIVGDGEQDSDLTFGSMAGAIRKCQTDFGVTIDLDLHSIQKTDGLSRAHCVMGTIHYPERAPEGDEFSEYSDGLLLYFKASLTGDEPEDVREYRSRFAEFPHQSTGDQFFTESQFESYRMLGLHIVRTALQEIPSNLPLRAVFNELRGRWSPPPAVAEGVSTRLSAAYTALLDQLRSDSDLRYLDREIVPGLPAFTGTPTDAALRKGPLFCSDCIRLAESIFVDLQLRSRREREKRENQGWIAIFRHWAAQPHIRETWRSVGVTLNPHFRQYFESLVSEGAPRT